MTTGEEVREQAADNSIMNTEPVVAKAAAVGIATSLLVAAGAFGLVTEEQRTIIIEQVGNITYGLFVILPLVITMISALWGRLSAFAPKTAAMIALVNLRKPTSAEPTLTV